MTYYSQCGQDRFLNLNIFQDFKNGFFVDVGAHDGKTLNNTLFFEETLGWKGINIEPILSVYNSLTENRPLSTNINCAVDTKDGSANFYQNTGYTEMLSGLESHYDTRHMERCIHENEILGGTTAVIVVPTKRLETILDEYSVKHVHYLSIDVEGAEKSVIESINFDKVFIDVIQFENNYSDSSSSIIEYLKGKGYKFMKKDKLDIFMIHTHSQFMKQ
jgi:FkbM family methyltransferase